MRLAQNVATRFAARSTIKPGEWREFSPGEYIHGEVFTRPYTYPVRGYLTPGEIVDGNRKFQFQLRQRQETLLDYETALKTRSGPVWELLLKDFRGDEKDVLRFVTDQNKKTEKAAHPRSAEDVRGICMADDGAAFFKGEGLLVGSSAAYHASERAHLIHLLEMGGTSADLKNFAKTQAKLDDKPGILNQA